ncbi:hypothetical protein GDO86_006807 [Hymenochirus boettgeri]|uniref:TGF-beta family profile domain-containing protein n=1 Tax=Hymenochirus boettgeri TaxID=247094 RepID=A0A8T2JCE3_9PIPI|nr:hypothetical protein GDO86_006807 [Hymenochirus boettgeri]
MTLINQLLCLILIPPIFGMPSVLHRRESVNPGSVLGLKDPPAHHGTSHSQDRKFPTFMMQLYQNIIRGNDKNLPTLEKTTLQESDTVQSFIAKSYRTVGNRWTLYFDMSSISRSDDLKLAELRICIPSFGKSRELTVEIYHAKNEKEIMFIGSFKSSLFMAVEDDCKVFNLTKVFQNYIMKGKSLILDEYIQAKGQNLRYLEAGPRKAEADKSDTAKRDQAHISNFTAEKIILVIFAKENPHDKPDPPSLAKKLYPSKYGLSDNNKISGFRRHRRNKMVKKQISASTLPPKPVEPSKPHCRKVDMFVDFHKIGWGSWVIYPRTYNAYRCEASCAVPMNETERATNYDYIKSLIPLNDLERAECPSCVPVKTRPLTMLYYENEDFVLRHHKEMIVEECGFI